MPQLPSMRALLLGAAVLCAAPAAAHAFCGFYVGGAGAQMFNNATQVVLMRQGTTTVLSMQNNYQGPPEHFALVVPVPVVIQESQVKTLPRELFAKVDTLGAPRLVEYWEQDPCLVEREYEEDEADMVLESSSVDRSAEPPAPKDYKVTIEAQFTVGEYDIVVLSAKDSTGLSRWLIDNKYKIPAGAEPLLRPYIESGTKFFVAKVDPKKVTFVNGMATLSPLRFHYDSPEFSLPIRLGLASSSGTQDLIVNILAPTRYEVANYPNTLIPTNITVRDSVRTRFAEFYAALFDETQRAVPGAVVTEYAWSASSCDPCPGPTLDADDLATLGADVVAETYKGTDPLDVTLTRLHARYGKDTSQDLVFRAVDTITGGVGVPDQAGKLEAKMSSWGTNMFQGRYVILHPWTSAVSCESPRRGNWGGPPSAQMASPTAATNLAFAPRGKLALAEHVTSDVTQLGVISSGGAELPPLQRKPRTCGCASAGGGASASALALLAIAFLRRRRTRSHT